jgi:hypothetical protein
MQVLKWALEKFGVDVIFREMNMGHNQLHMQVLLHDALIELFSSKRGKRN